MLKRSRPPARKEKAHSRVESAACCWAGVEAQKNPLPEGKGSFCRGRLVLDGSPGDDLPSQLFHVAVEFIKVH